MVLVVDILTRQQLPPNVFFHHQIMLQTIPSVAPRHDTDRNVTI